MAGANLNIGDTFGLWTVTKLPFYLPKGEILKCSKCTCVCSGCGDNFQVQVRYLLGGKSKGCRSCRANEQARRNLALGIKGGRPADKNNPHCTKCNTKMLTAGGRRTVKKTG